MTTLRFRRLTVFPVVLVIMLALPPVALAQDGGDAPASELSGRILDASEAPMAGVKVIAYHLSSEKVFRSDATNAKGEYLITGLPYGYFDLAVETEGGIFVASQVVNVAPASKNVVTLSLGQPGAIAETASRSFPGTDQAPIGEARVQEKLGGSDFWRSPKGVGILAASGGALLLAIAGGGGSSNASPSSR